MSKRLDTNSRDILEFRPNIHFVEPEVTSVAPTPIPEPLQTDQIRKQVDQAVALAKAVDTLAAAVQARADLRADGLVIALHPGPDAATIAAMRRLYPDDNPNQITYDQYRNCKDQQLQHGVSLAEGIVVSQDEVDKTRQEFAKTSAAGGDVQKIQLNQIGGFGTPEAGNGGLRPELKDNLQIVKPLDMKEVQDLLIKHFVNFIWKNFIKPIIPLPFLPNKIAKVPKGTRAEQYIAAAEESAKVPKLQTDDLAASAISSAKGSSSATLPDEEDLLSGFAAREPKVSQPFKFHDCQTVTKTFERAAHFCTTEESVFAMLTPTLLSMRATAQGFLIQAESNNSLLQGVEDIKDEVEQDAESSQKKEDWLAEWLLDCIPCVERMSIGKISFSKIWEELYDQLMAIVEYYKKQLEMLKKMLDFFNYEEQYVDLCALRNFFLKFVCLPDLRALIAAFMALLMKLAFELTALFDIVLGLIAPLITPFLTALINLVTQIIMMIVKPINCIIDSLINMLNKADWSELFKGGAAFNVSIGTDEPTATARFSKIPIPFTDKRLPDLSLPTLIPKTEFNLHEIATSAIGIPGLYTVADHMKAEQQAVDDANAELAAIRKKMGDVDMSDAQQRKKYYEELEAAKAKQREAINEQQFSEAQQAAQQLRELKKIVNSVFAKIIEFTREIVEAIEQFFVDLVDEFKKLLGDILGANTGVTVKLFKKLEIIKLISAIIALVAALSKKIDCDDILENAQPHILLPTRQGLSVVTDEFGNISIIEDPEAIKGAIDDVVAALQPSGASDGRPRQNLKSLIEFTGDPVLDSEIARVAEAVETPTSVTYKCPLVTSVTDVERVNKWIRELNTL